jgi:hypothetical protein
LEEENRWKTYKFDFSTLGIENNQFNGIVLYFFKFTTQSYEINIGSIELIKNENAPDAGKCLEIENIRGGEAISFISSGDDSTNQTNKKTPFKRRGNSEIGIGSSMAINSVTNTTVEANVSVYIDILSLESMSDYPQVIIIKCNNFRKIENENMALLFFPRGSPNYIQTESCILPNEETIPSFSCKVPNVLPDGIYNVRSPSNIRYIINFSNNIIINNGIISISNNNENNTNSNAIVITNSINKVINKGDKIFFEITPINADKYYLDNSEIIFVDQTQTKALYLKNCEEYISNSQIISITCRVSNNIMKANYTTISNGQHIYISPGQYINLIGISSIGGAFSEVLDKEVNTNLTSSEELAFSLNFKILYYNSGIKPSDIFPHKVFLYGLKDSSLRKLDDNLYNCNISFQNCIAGNYSSEDPSAIGSIECRFPDYVPAGTYVKLKSDGFDNMPNSKVNLVFKKDFIRDNPISTNDFPRVEGNYFGSSSSSSKIWKVCLVIIIVVVALVIITIIACLINRKVRDKEDNSDEKSISKSSQSNMSKTIDKEFIK